MRSKISIAQYVAQYVQKIATVMVKCKAILLIVCVLLVSGSIFVSTANADTISSAANHGDSSKTYSTSTYGRHHKHKHVRHKNHHVAQANKHRLLGRTYHHTYSKHYEEHASGGSLPANHNQTSHILANSSSTNYDYKTLDEFTKQGAATTVGPTGLDIASVAHQPRLNSYSALAMDASTGKVLVSKNPSVKLPIASITKLMTAMVLLDSHADLDEYITITASDIDTLKNTTSRLRVGARVKRRDLLLLALMSSENRAAHALARTAYAGGLDMFIAKMNDKAKSLAMYDSQFYDPTGLTNANQSTAKDLSKMVQAAFNYSVIRQYTTTKSADVALSAGYVHRYINSDALVRVGKFPIELSKTGFINEAGHCLVLYTLVKNQPMVMVFLNSIPKNGRLADAMAVRNYIQLEQS